LIHAGLRERDTSGLNRFRLVIGVDDPDQCSQKAEDLLRDTGIYDERLHIHIVGKDELDLLQI
ncbi:MAG: hypothetical protein GWO41_06380, partial [candidate division Zixibacteria bacterium]|nr:hypothetical protein [candidate division Zixibacteria bacterium]NIR63517.1 hypothetical protein [candidate division Zixibacteria bacterium]NIS46190.1 hypothetical protein [candidate division Zixibacteria bacterium]NIT52365.1 hypothetical protein [candidate division Zixibacteria bacterium]NIU14292.1 hypothetical protein [candidate division Zixibacteria bacterium]